MRIYLDGMFFRATGVGRVYENLLGALLGFPEIDALLTAVPLAEQEQFLDRYGSSKVRPIFLPYGPMSVGDLVLKALALRRLHTRVDLFYFPGHNVPLFAPKPYVVTVNDITVFTPLVLISAARKRAFRWLLSGAIRRARQVVSISQTARGEIARLFPHAEGKIEVLYPWVDDSFFDVARGILPEYRAERAVSGDYLLYLGLRIHHKNLDGLLAAFELLAPEFPELRLVIAGRRYGKPDMVDTWKDSSPLATRVVEIIDPTDQEVLHLLAGARAFVFPSFAEGFGLPPVEAMAAGVPVVCSNLNVLREVLGEGALFGDPRFPEQIAGLTRRLLRDARGSAALAARGRQRAALFSCQCAHPRLRDLLRYNALPA